MFVCLFVCLFFELFVFILIILGHPQKYTLKISWRSDLIWLRYIGFLKMFICCCLFVCLLNCFFFYNNCHRTPTGIYPENFMRIGLDLAEIKNVCLFACLCVNRLVFFIFIILGHPQEYTLKILWRYDLIWLR